MERSRMALRATITALAILAVSTNLAQADLVPNGDFQYYDDSWTVLWYDGMEDTGDWVHYYYLYEMGGYDDDVVSFDGDTVMLQERLEYDDEGKSYTGIENACTLLPSDTCLRFDFSAGWVVGGETDSFIVGLYDSPDHAVWSRVVATTDDGADDFEAAGYTDLGPDREDWWSASWDVSCLAPGDYTVRFLLEGEDDQQTQVWIDNVMTCAVPVPGAMLLGSVGLGYAGLRLRRRTARDAGL